MKTIHPFIKKTQLQVTISIFITNVVSGKERREDSINIIIIYN